MLVGETGVLVAVGGMGVLVAVGSGVLVAVGGKSVLVGVAVGPDEPVTTSSGGWLPSREENETPSVLLLESTKL